MSAEQALIHIEAGLRALLNESVVIDARGERPAGELECTVADDLERIGRAIGGKGPGLIDAIADGVREAIVELAAARDQLRKVVP